jgi:hypothetical protein
MIRFFRKIRFDLMEKNKTGKYLKYAIGEIILVVIGILIALSINTWNEERKEKIIVTNLLKGIRYDLVADTIEFSNRLKRIPSFIDNAKSLLDGRFSDTLSANDLYFKLPYTVFNYKIKNQSYQKVINSGITDFYEFNNLFDKINTYYTIDANDLSQLIGWDYDDTIDDGKFWSALGFEVDIYTNTFYKENEIAFAQPETRRKAVFLEQLNSPNLRNSVKNNLYRKMRLNKAISDIKQKVNGIIARIDEQLQE